MESRFTRSLLDRLKAINKGCPYKPDPSHQVTPRPTDYTLSSHPAYHYLVCERIPLLGLDADCSMFTRYKRSYIPHFYHFQSLSL